MHKIVVVLAALAVACGSSAPSDSVTLSTAITGPGAVSLQPTPEACSTCAAGDYRYARGTAVSIVAVPQQGAALTTWGGACDGNSACSVRLDADRSVVAVFERNSAAVGVQLTGDGQGAVTSAPAGIDCGGLCTAEFAVGSTVTLTAAPRSGSTFTGWSGACSGAGTCVVTVNQAHSVSALFGRTAANVATGRSGPGTVLSSPAGIACGAACIAQFAQGTQVSLIAVPDANAAFAGWSGACTGTGACVVAAGSGAIATANFTRAQHLVGVSASGTGTGTVFSAPAGLSCGTSCSASFDQGATVVLVANPDPGSIFEGWSGDCTGIAACVVGIDADKAIVASFAPAPPGVTPNPPPTLLASSPNRVVAGATGVVLTLTGLNFQPGSVGFWNGQPRDTQFVDGSTLRVTLLDADVAVATIPFSSFFAVSVGTPAPGGGVSASIAFTVVNPTPTLTSLDPSSAPLNSAPFQMTLTGTNFLPSSQILFGGFQAFGTTTYVSPTQLLFSITASMLGFAQTLQISVSNDPSSRATSNSLPFSVNNPAPVAASVSPATLPAGSGDAVLTIYGSGFLSFSAFVLFPTVARWNGTALVTSVLSSTELRATVPAALLAAPGTAGLTVSTIGPGGGETVPLAFKVFVPGPEVTSFEPDSVAAGAAGFTLTIRGRGFDSGSTVSWNGAARPTTLVNPTTLQIEVADTDVAAVGSGAIVVSNANGTTPVAGFPILAATPAVTSTVAAAVAARGLVWDPVRRLFYASVGSTAPANGNSVVIIDTNGAVVDSVVTGSEPGRLSLSDDASKLYVALDGASLVQRIDLASRAIDLEFPLGNAVVSDIQAVPGSPGSVAVARTQFNSFPFGLGVVIYDEGVARPEVGGSFGSQSNVIAFASPDSLFTYDNSTTAFSLQRFQIVPTGLYATDGFSAISGFGVDIRADSGRIYSSNGFVSNLVGTRIGTFALPPFQTASVQPDWAHGRVFFLSGATLSAFDAGSFRPLGSVPLTDSSVFGRFVRWDADGIAYRTSTQVILLRSSLVGG